MIKAVIFDLDGTIYVGGTPVPGAKEKIEELKGKGIQVIFLTNAGTSSRRSLAAKLGKMGFATEEKDVYCGAYILAKYIEEHRKGKSVFVLGERGIPEECEALGIPLAKSGADIVAVGLDRQLTYEKLSQALGELERGAELFATNKDATYPTEKGLMPGAGAIVAALEYASGRKAHVSGKPAAYTMKLIEREHGLKNDEVLMVGDRLDTDIRFARDCKVKSALVLTGITKKGEKWDIDPDYVFDSVADLSLP